MAEIVNLKRIRKMRARADAAGLADANRAKHGRTKEERLRTEAEQAVAARKLDGAKLEDT
jgi:hypothetical protein